MCIYIFLILGEVISFCELGFKLSSNVCIINIQCFIELFI